MASALVQTVAANNGTSYASSGTAAFASNVTAGTYLVCFVTTSNAVANTVSGITDTRGNTWSRIVSSTAQYNNTELWGAANANAGANTLTISTGANFVQANYVAREYSGLTTSPVDVSAGAAEANGVYVQTHATATTLATAQANELVVTALGTSAPNDNTFAATGYGNLQYTQNTSTGIVSMSAGNKVVAATGTQSATWTSTGFDSGVTLIATLKIATVVASSNNGQGFLGFFD